MTLTREFEYRRAESVDEAMALLASLGPEAKLLAGGHSLIPAMKVRLAAPSALVDLGGIAELRSIDPVDGGVRIGAMVTHTAVAESDAVRASAPALAEAAAGIGDLQVRNSGTIGGSLAHADPAADYPALVLALDATIRTAGSGGSRTIAADDFFTGMFATALEDGEIITAVTVPASMGAAYVKWAHPASRYAVVGVAACLAGTDGRCSSARVAVTGAASSAFRIGALEEALVGADPAGVDVGGIVANAVDAGSLMSDSGASAEFRAHLTAVMAARAVGEAATRAGI